MQNPNYLLKGILLGMPGVGKTQISNRWRKANFNSTHRQSIGADFADITITTDERQIKLQLWDTPDDRDAIINPLAMFRNPDIFFIVVAADKTKDENRDQIQTWLNWIQQNKLANNKTKIVIIQNKIDVATPILLTQEDLQPLNNKYIYLHIYSANNSDHEPLDHMLRSILPQLSPALAPAQNDNYQ